MDKITTSEKIILVVDDDLLALRAVCDKFKSEGFGIREAKNGEEGLTTALRDHPDLILLDIMMPVMDGMTMLRKLRETNEWGKTVPVIMLTSLTADDEERMRDITELTPTYYLAKADWKLEDLVEKVRDRLETLHS